MGDKGHFWISIIKSTIRIEGFSLAIFNLTDGLLLLIIAEVLSILEKIVDKRGK
jgi:hypothetical protein